MTIKLAEFGFLTKIGTSDDSAEFATGPFRTHYCMFNIPVTGRCISMTQNGANHYVYNTDAAPEVLNDDDRMVYGYGVDVWSAGVVLYICLCGFPPFSEELYSAQFPYSLDQQIKLGQFDYPSPYWDPIGDPALDLIDSILLVDTEKRFTAEQSLNHPWMLSDSDNRASFIDQLRTASPEPMVEEDAVED